MMKSLVRAFRAAVIFTLLPAGVNLLAQSGPIDVPVREVVLFSSGVGYFQHEGMVKGDGQTLLRFKTAQMNDILKSLVLQDLDGGHVGVVTYPSQDPLEKILASFQLDLSDDPSMGDLLDKLRGASVSLRYGGDSISGKVLGVEKRQVPGAGKADEKPLEKTFLNLVTDKGLTSLALEDVQAIKLNDPGLQDELNRALAAVAGARDQDKKPVEIHFNGTGERRVRLGYVVETPVWKASYRLVLPGDKDKDKDVKGTLQGWAMVDNQTDNDWADVRLSLVSGRPISFQQNLYQPLYATRPTVVPEQYASLKPQEYEDGQSKSKERVIVTGSNIPTAAEAGIGRAALSQAAAPARDYTGAPPENAPAESLPEKMGTSILPTTDTAKVGELFQYTVGNVSLARQRSAMIPILNDPVPVEKLSIYNESALATHPLNGVRLHNDTPDKKHLLQGPVTVFAEGRYAGDARLDDVPPGQTRLLSYSIDLETLVNVNHVYPREALLTGKIVKGVLEATYKLVHTTEYHLDNKADHDKTLVVEEPRQEEFKLAGTAAPVETTDTLYRFQQMVKAGKTEKFIVTQEKTQANKIVLVDDKLEDILFYSRAGEIPAPVREALAKASSLKQSVVDSQRQIDEREAQIKTLDTDQNRIRENLKTVGKTGDFAGRQLKKLDDQENQIDRLRAEIDALLTKLNAQQHALEDYLGGLNVG